MTSKVVGSGATNVHKCRSHCGDRQRRNIVSQTTLTRRNQQATSSKMMSESKLFLAPLSDSQEKRKCWKQLFIPESQILVFRKERGASKMYLFVIRASPVSEFFHKFLES